MGSHLRLVVVGGTARERRAAWVTVREEFERTEEALSRFRDSAELVALDRAPGTWVTVSRRLYRAVALADRAWRRSGGRFDPRILGRLEELGEHGAAVAIEDTGGSRPRLATGSPAARDPRASRLLVRDPIDLGGLGKGLALRWALGAARAVAPSLGGLLVDAGGDVAAAGRPADAERWRIGVEDPFGGTEPLAVVEVAGGSLATSSTRVRRWLSDDGRPVHHLIDPRTGEPGGDGLVAVTVAGLDPAWSEVATKELFLAGSSRIGPEARARDLAAWWVTADGVLAMTPAARVATVWERGPTPGGTRPPGDSGLPSAVPGA
jgi:thiamine biosynthesis lipoprotein